MSAGNYFFIDGSALTAQVRQLQRLHPRFRNRRLCPRLFMGHFITFLPDLHRREYKRVTFYFPRGDETAIEDFLLIPDHRQPGLLKDLHFKFCGHKLKKSAEFSKFVEEVVPLKFHDRCAKSEKGIDIEMCCDGLRLASASRIKRLFLLTNDGDFIPFCKTIKEFGSNVSIIHLSEATLPNIDLLREADSYDVIPFEYLDQMFVPAYVDALPVNELASSNLENGVLLETPSETISEKPEADPSDLSKSTEPENP